MPLNLIFTQPGNYTVEDNGIPGDNTSVIKDGNGVVIFTFVHPADAVGFTVGTAGVNLTINFTDTLGAANFTIGSLTDAAASPDSIAMNRVNTAGTVTLVANGSITEGGSDAAADITAGALVLSAGTGIGTGANAIETRTGLFEAETTTGGIAVSNIGAVQIGGVAAEVDGLDVVTSGNINFSTVGSIFLSEANSATAEEVVHGGTTSGNVALTAIGFNADIIGNVDNGAVSAPRGSLTLTAGRDIQLGTIGSNFNNDAIANNAVNFVAGRDILIDGFADVLSDIFGLDTGGDMVMTAGRNIGILNIAGTSASVAASGSGGGDAIITTGADGALTVAGPGSFALGSTSGDVIVNADRVLIDAASGISASSGQVFIRPMSEGRETILGSASDAALALELSDVELNRIFTPTLTIGGTAAGPITAIAALNPAGIQNLGLISGTDITLGSSLTVAQALTLRAGDNVHFLSGSATNTGGALNIFVDQAGDDGNTGGFDTLGGTFAVGSAEITGSVDADTLRGVSNDIAQLVHGNGGNDTIFSTGEGEYFGDGGNDTIVAGLSGGIPGEILDGGTGTDTLDTTSYTGDYAINLATGTTGFDYESFVNFENVTTGEGNDAITGTSGANIIRTGIGNDTLDGGGGADTLIGGLGNDNYHVDTSGDVVNEAAAEGTDRIFASSNYVLAAGVSIETLSTAATLATTAITLIGNELANNIYGNYGNNGLFGSGGNDTLIGHNGDDTLNGGLGTDTMSGGLGNDNFYVDTSTDTVSEAAGQGTDRIFTSSNYVLGAGISIETLSTDNAAGTAAITLIGNELANNVYGNFGNNSLYGSSGNDSIIAHAGNDLLNGGAGADALTGGAGADTFVFANAAGPGNIDSIGDYVVADDVIHIDNAIFTGLPAGTLAAGAFRIGAAAADADDRIVYNSATGALFFDADGNGAGAAIQFATLATGLAMTAGEFFVI